MKKETIIIYICMLITCLFVIYQLINVINKQNQKIDEYQLALANKELELERKSMAYDEYHELFLNCFYSYDIPSQEEK